MLFFKEKITVTQLIKNYKMVAQLKKFSISEILNQLLNVFFNRVNKSINSIVINQSYIIKETNAMTILFMNENSVSFVCI